jgi:hypothetical protein
MEAGGESEMVQDQPPPVAEEAAAVEIQGEAEVVADALAAVTLEAKATEEVPKETTADGAMSDDTDEDDEETIEESPCGRYNKRREVVKYRDVPGIDTAYLAMDTEEGVEVVWNEAIFSGSKKFKTQEDKLKNVFEALTLIDHPNIVKFHRYWTDGGTTNEKTGHKDPPRVIN